MIAAEPRTGFETLARTLARRVARRAAARVESEISARRGDADRWRKPRLLWPNFTGDMR